MGSVLGISVGGTLVQNTLRINLSSALSDRGVDIDDVSVCRCLTNNSFSLTYINRSSNVRARHSLRYPLFLQQSKELFELHMPRRSVLHIFSHLF